MDSYIDSFQRTKKLRLGKLELYRNLALFLSVILSLFLSTTIAYALGISRVATSSLSLLTLLIFFSILANKSQFFKRSKSDTYLMFFALFLMCYMTYRDGIDGFKFVFFFSLFPFLTSSYLYGVSKSALKMVKLALLIFYISECCLGIFERIFFINLFPNINDTSMLYLTEDWAFRSTSLLGHPLHNALAVSIISGFIFITTELKVQSKVYLLILGMFSLFCFNARGAIIIWFILLGIFAIRNLKHNIPNVIATVTKLAFILPIIVIGVYFLSISSFGGRVFHSAVIDGSASTRWEVFNFYKYISLEDLFCGSGDNYIYVMNQLGAGGVENSIIALILKYGLILGLTSIVFYFFWLKRLLASYLFEDRFVLVFSFVILGMTNNGLAIYFPWLLFVFCAHTFPFQSRYKKHEK